ncbi:MAG: nodulation protein NfeD [Methanosarcinales archaeon]
MNEVSVDLACKVGERKRPVKKWIIVLSLVLVILSTLSSTLSLPNKTVLVVDVDETITSATSENIAHAIKEAHENGYEAVILLLNTPGGSVAAMNEITREIEDSSVPVIGYVYPSGGHAWSAGTFILLDTHIAAMAPFTIIGSAQPVQSTISGTIEPVNESKIINAFVKDITEKARMHNRNETAAAKFITENLNLNADEALKYNVIEVIAENVPELLEKVDGMKVSTKYGERILDTKYATVKEHIPSTRTAFMRTISDPIISSILLLIGIYGIIFGLSSPGVGGELVGAIALILGLIGMGFDVNLAGILFIILGIVLLIYELYVHSFGLLAGAGILCIGIGSVLLVPTSPEKWFIAPTWYRSFYRIIISISAVIAIFFGFVIYKVVSLRLKKPVIGSGFTEPAIALENISANSYGFVMVQGERWKATSDQDVKKGQKLKVIKKEGPILIVTPLDSEQ